MISLKQITDLKKYRFKLIFFSFIFLSLLIVLIPNSKGLTYSFINFKDNPSHTSFYLSTNLTNTEKDDYYRILYDIGNYTEPDFLNCSFQEKLIGYNYSIQSNYTKYLVNQFYLDFSEREINNTINFTYSIKNQVKYLSNNSESYQNDFYVYISNFNLTIKNNLDLFQYNYSFNTNTTLDIQLHTYIRDNYSFSRMYIYNNSELLLKQPFTAFNNSFDNFYLSYQELLSNVSYTEFYGLRNMYYNSTLEFTNFISFPLFLDTYFFDTSIIRKVKIPFFIFLILLFIEILIWLYVKNVMRKSYTQFQIKLKWNIVFGVIAFVILLFATDRISIYILLVSEGNLLFTLLNALCLGVYLNAIGLSGGNFFKKAYIKISILLIVAFCSLFVFGLSDFYIQFNFPFNLLFYGYNKFSTATIDGIYFYYLNLVGFFGLVYLLSFILESEA